METLRNKISKQNGPAWIIFDGTSYYGVYDCDIDDICSEDEDIEKIQKYQYWSDEMDDEIDRLNSEI